MTNVKQIAIALIGSAVIIALLAVWFQAKHAPPTLELTEQDEAFNIDGPLPAEELERVEELEKVNEQATADSTMNPKAIFTTNRGVVTLELYEDAMPVTVGNFTKLAESGYYNGTKFHRVIDGFMIQGGDPNSKGDNPATYGTGGPGYTIQDEFVDDPRLSNVRGTISMANTGQPNSGGSQFFINTADNLGLDFNKPPAQSSHPVFGRVIDGMDVVDTISSTETNPMDLPVEPVVIESVQIVRN